MLLWEVVVIFCENEEGKVSILWFVKLLLM